MGDSVFIGFIVIRRVKGVDFILFLLIICNLIWNDFIWFELVFGGL